ncbi:hypothetical protein HDU78_006981 [Chytriomyces hyalinus]|nr:hypothetical protein HDU78_006981 [Chytriomyces hyalinus]
MSVPTVVVIGGSFAGTHFITALDGLLKSKANIILIEERDHFYNNIAALRSLTETGVAAKLWIPYTNIFQNNKNSKVIQSRVTEIHENAVTLANGDSVAFNYLVIATGSSVPSPSKTTKLTKSDGVSEASTILAAIGAAKSVAIVGGGVVGVELAGEIATDFPTVKVTLIHSGANLLNRSGAKPKTIEVTNKQLAGLKVDVRLNERVVNSDGETSILPSNAGYGLSPFTLTTQSGAKIESDVQFIATGITKPNSDLAATLGNVLDSHGYIVTKPTGQLTSFANIFAIGDVSTLDSGKLAWFAGQQATLVAGNVAALINGSKTALKEYKASEPGAFLIASIGRNGGVLQSPIGVFGPWLPKQLKSKDMMVQKPWKDLKVDMNSAN